MTNTAIVSDKLADKFRTEKETPYTHFIASEGLDIRKRKLCAIAARDRAEAVGASRWQCGFLNHDASRTDERLLCEWRLLLAASLSRIGSCSRRLC